MSLTNTSSIDLYVRNKCSNQHLDVPSHDYVYTQTKQLAMAEEDCKRKSRQLAELKKSSEQRDSQLKKEQQATLKMLEDRVAETDSQLREYQDVVIVSDKYHFRP